MSIKINERSYWERQIGRFNERQQFDTYEGDISFRDIRHFFSKWENGVAHTEIEGAAARDVVGSLYLRVLAHRHQLFTEHRGLLSRIRESVQTVLAPKTDIDVVRKEVAACQKGLSALAKKVGDGAMRMYAQEICLKKAPEEELLAFPIEGERRMVHLSKEESEEIAPVFEGLKETLFGYKELLQKQASEAQKLDRKLESLSLWPKASIRWAEIDGLLESVEFEGEHLAHTFKLAAQIKNEALPVLCNQSLDASYREQLRSSVLANVWDLCSQTEDHKELKPLNEVINEIGEFIEEFEAPLRGPKPLELCRVEEQVAAGLRLIEEKPLTEHFLSGFQKLHGRLSGRRGESAHVDRLLAGLDQILGRSVSPKGAR